MIKLNMLNPFPYSGRHEEYKRGFMLSIVDTYTLLTESSVNQDNFYNNVARKLKSESARFNLQEAIREKQRTPLPNRINWDFSNPFTPRQQSTFAIVNLSTS